VTRIDIPPGGSTPFDHHPHAWAAFRRYYAALWSEGIVDQPTKEVGRLRNARVTGCGICRNLRFQGARDAGLTEAHVERIDDEYEQADLPARWKLAARYADALIHEPASVQAKLGDALLAELSPAEIVELTAVITTAIAFSKAAVAFGAPPDMPVMEVPTPAVE
jgi:alkylhydroperoxidase family enzyme